MSMPQHRERPRAPIVLSAAFMIAAGFCPGAGRVPEAVAAQSTRSLQGAIPKAPPYVSGFPVLFFRPTDYRDRMGAVAAADLDRDGRTEIVASVPAGVVTVVGLAGRTRAGWPRRFQDLPQPAWPVGDPAIGDLDGDGLDEIVVCVVSQGPARRSFLFALRHDGTDLPGWPVEVHGASANDACSPAGVLLADLDGDGRPEVVRALGGGMVVALDSSGRAVRGWPFRLGPDAYGRHKEINADLACGDLDGDGADEVVLLESGLMPRLAAIDGDGVLMPGFPVVLAEVTDRQAPLVVDLDRDPDRRPELVVSTLPFTGEIDPTGGDAPGDAARPAALHVLRADGTSLPGWPRTLVEGAAWGPTSADIDGDRRPDILQEDGDQLYAFDAAGAVLPGFPQTLHRDFLRSQSLETSRWIAADLDGDSALDLLQVHSNLYAGSAYLRVFGVRPSGKRVRGFPFDAPGFLASSRPVVADVSGDGIGDLVLLVSDGTYGGWYLLAWDLGALLPGR